MVHIRVLDLSLSPGLLLHIMKVSILYAEPDHARHSRRVPVYKSERTVRTL